jgi:hypothetical protein
MSDKSMNELAQIIKSILPITIKNFNQVRLPALESAWGRTFIDEMANESQVTVEIAKNYARPFNNELYRNILTKINQFQEDTTKGSDFTFYGIPVEHKNSFSPDSNSFTGNGFDKTPFHLLMKFSTDENGRINKCFSCIIDTSKMTKQWSDKSTTSNFSSLKLTNDDIKHAIIISGSLVPLKKYAKMVLEIVQ